MGPQGCWTQDTLLLLTGREAPETGSREVLGQVDGHQGAETDRAVGIQNAAKGRGGGHH